VYCDNALTYCEGVRPVLWLKIDSKDNN